ncbi:phosphatase PAP2 family protein [Culicoidibacter larvae]|uniref:Phosphatase PAP2 family protein n=1 Tax=Culicoidibacter larvae TaxID=2579976 RepID=A0A5R8QHE6_9FIRM|nr:phosphatase PAP2 family protein [Culicoidibacter larvae]TLG77465.1 phosphatase PAP2 family protein [Culicoidibacter larvae]
MFNFIDGLDQAFMLWLHQFGGNIVLDYLAMMMAFLGDKGLIWLLPAIIMLFFKKYRHIGILIIISMAITALEVELLKNIVARPRPYVTLGFDDMLVNENPFKSFPSGHASSAFAAAIIYAKFFKKYRWGFIGFAILMLVSRLYLFVHYPSDVLVGTAIGIINALLVYTIYQHRAKIKQIIFREDLKNTEV